VHHKPPNSFVDGGKFKEGVKGGKELSRTPKALSVLKMADTFMGKGYEGAIEERHIFF
jgi:hypothetical protein